MKNPYLADGRLGDVIAAITVLGTYKFYKLETGRWADRITGSPHSASDIAKRFSLMNFHLEKSGWKFRTGPNERL